MVYLVGNIQYIIYLRMYSLMRSCSSLVTWCSPRSQGPPSKHVDVVDLIIRQMLHLAFPNKSLTFTQQLVKTLLHERQATASEASKAPARDARDASQDAAAGGKGRQLQVTVGRHGRMPPTSRGIL